MNRTKQIYKKVVRDGGVTLKKDFSEPKKLNYVASFKGFEKVIKESAFNVKSLFKFLSVYKDVASLRGAYIGIWKSDDKVYFDISRNFKSRRCCERFAKRNGQIAYYDAINGASVVLK